MGRLVAAPQAADAATKIATPSRNARSRAVALCEPPEQYEQGGVHDRVGVQHPREVPEVPRA